MELIWDEPKRLANLDKHAMDFARLTEDFSTTQQSSRRTEIDIWRSGYLLAVQ